MAAEGALLLDVREADEWRAGHLSGALHLPLGRLSEQVPEPGPTIVVVCRSGARSAAATGFLIERGHDAVNMTGGMQAWQRCGLPIVTDDGQPGTVA
jgi:rhodanese-related sulfurtransferase